MATKNLEQLQEEAKSLNLDPADYDGKAELQEAIEDAKAAKGEEKQVPNEADIKKADQETPSDSQAPSEKTGVTTTESIKEPAEKLASKSKKAEKGSPEATFETSKPVSFIIDGEKFEGTVFTFPDAETAKSRKDMLVERYGAEIIKEDVKE